MSIDRQLSTVRFEPYRHQVPDPIPPIFFLRLPGFCQNQLEAGTPFLSPSMAKLPNEPISPFMGAGWMTASATASLWLDGMAPRAS
jgi:hypothetical protein